MLPRVLEKTVTTQPKSASCAALDKASYRPSNGPTPERPEVANEEAFFPQDFNAPRQGTNPQEQASAICPSSKIFVEPEENDVLPGRGGRANSNPGNRLFIAMICERRQEYAASPKGQKRMISQAIVRALKQKGCRFLQVEEQSGQWAVMSDNAAAAKTASAIRDSLRHEAFPRRSSLSSVESSPSRVQSFGVVERNTWFGAQKQAVPVSLYSPYFHEKGKPQLVPPTVEMILPQPPQGFRWSLSMVPSGSLRHPDAKTLRPHRNDQYVS
jgi:hypothetical protein